MVFHERRLRPLLDAAGQGYSDDRSGIRPSVDTSTYRHRDVRYGNSSNSNNVHRVQHCFITPGQRRHVNPSSNPGKGWWTKLKPYCLIQHMTISPVHSPPSILLQICPKRDSNLGPNRLSILEFEFKSCWIRPFRHPGRYWTKFLQVKKIFGGWISKCKRWLVK